VRFRYQIIGLPIVAAIVVGLSIAINAHINVDAAANLEEVEKVQYPLVESLRALRADQAAISDALRQALTEGDTSDLDKARDQFGQAQQTLTRMATLGDSPQRQAEELRREFQAYYSAALDATHLMLDKNAPDTSSAIAAMQQHQQSLGSMLTQQDTRAENDFRDLMSATTVGMHRTLRVSVISGVTTLLFLIFGSWIVIGGIFRSLGGDPESTVKVVRHIARGNFSRRIRLRPGDEGSLLLDIRSLQQTLQRVIIDVRGSSRFVDASSDHMDQAVAQLSERTTSQASSLEETANSMEKITDTVHQTADNARNANQLAMLARERAEAGGAVVGRAITAMSSITASSVRIGDIIGVIDEIAFQTNLLALNAAVEAARAGDQGRGFAVVAAEVRALAQRSATAAREIKGLISGSVQQVQQGSLLVDETGKHLHEIVDSIAKVAGIVNEIADASQDQARGLSEVNASMGHIDSMTQRNASMVDEISAVARDVSAHARHLTGLVDSFIVDESKLDAPGTGLPSTSASTPASTTPAGATTARGDRQAATLAA
jgi:methyl-accepting chemotaxis protein